MEPTFVFVHGVGMWPATFAPLQARCTPSTRWVRPGYEGSPAVDGFDDQVALLVDAIAAHAPAIVVGVSGGATLALAAAIVGADGLVAAVTHEPLVGALEPALDDRVQAGADALARTPDVATALQFLDALYGRASWTSTGESARRFVRRHIRTIARDVGQFASFSPTIDELAAVTVPHLTTVGERSGPERHRIARLLAGTGAWSRIVPGAGHHVVADAADPFTDLILRFARGVIR